MEEERTAYDLADWQGYLTHPEIDFLKQLARSLADNPVIINIGAGAGTSTLAFLEARLDARVFSIDTKLTDDDVTTNEYLRLKEVSEVKANRVIKIWGDSGVIATVWPYFVDMVFVDGDHTEPGVVNDIIWKHRLRVGGVMAFHDYGSKYWGAVKKSVDKYIVDLTDLGLVDSIKAFRV